DVQVHGTVEQPLGYGFFFPAKFHKRSSVCASICIFCIMAYIQFIKYITDTRHDLGAVADQPVGASAAAGIYVPGHRENVPSLLQCIISGDERAAFLTCLDDRHAMGHAAYDAVPGREIV